MPGAEHRNESGEQQMPPGLWIKQLPFADDIREPPETELVKAPASVIDAMRVIIRQLQLPKAVYDPQRYPNPSLQWFYRILQALALEEDLPEKAEDKTLPRYKQIHKRAGEYVVQWGEELDKQFAIWEKESRSNVHRTETGGAKRTKAEPGAAATKKAKAEDGEGVPDEDMRNAYMRNGINKYKVAELKSFVQGKGIGKGVTKKADLVDAVTGYFETKMNID